MKKPEIFERILRMRGKNIFEKIARLRRIGQRKKERFIKNTNTTKRKLREKIAICMVSIQSIDDAKQMREENLPLALQIMSDYGDNLNLLISLLQQAKNSGMNEIEGIKVDRLISKYTQKIKELQNDFDGKKAECVNYLIDKLQHSSKEEEIILFLTYIARLTGVHGAEQAVAQTKTHIAMRTESSAIRNLWCQRLDKALGEIKKSHNEKD